MTAKKIAWILQVRLADAQEELPDDCTDAQFLMRYLELSPVDLIIG